MKPILEGADAQRAVSMVDDIMAVVSTRFFECADAQSLAGMLLLFATVAQRREIDVDLTAAAQRTLDSIATSNMTSTLFSRLGFGLAAERALELLGSEIDLCGSIDLGLQANLAAGFDAASFDVVGGTAGRLIYLSQRPATVDTERIRRAQLDSLAQSAKRDAHGTFWLAPNSGKVDAGLAHGAAGIIYALAKIIERGWGETREAALLESSVAWVLAQRNAAKAPYLYPNFAAQTGFARLGWCYSDLSVAVALHHASRALGRSEWASEATKAADNAARLSVSESNVVDAALCHGAAGAGLVFAGLSEAFGSATLRAASAAWFNRVETFRRPDAALAGFAFRFDSQWLDRLDMLEGVSGIGLSLELACSPGDARWPRFWAYW